MEHLDTVKRENKNLAEEIKVQLLLLTPYKITLA